MTAWKVTCQYELWPHLGPTYRGLRRSYECKLHAPNAEIATTLVKNFVITMGVNASRGVIMGPTEVEPL